MDDSVPGRRPAPPVSVGRREFLAKVALRSAATVGVAAAAGALMYEQPRLRSFLPETTAYAQTSGAGKFTLKGTT